MGTVLHFDVPAKSPSRSEAGPVQPCEIIIFPGVRIERHELDLSFRLRDSAGHDDFDGIGGVGGVGGGSKRRPRKSS